MYTAYIMLSLSIAVDCKKNPGECYNGPCKNGKPGVTVSVEDDDFMDLATGDLNGPKVGN